MKTMRWTNKVLCLVAVLLAPLPAVGQDHGGGGGGGCGDVFGELIHILRDDATGQPILAMRWVELPKDEPGYGWGYCPIAVDEFGNKLGFAPLSCDVDPADLDRVVDTDYFGRLNGGRTKERNQRMHFNEVIDNIKASCEVKQEETGRLKIGYCDDDGKLEEWATVDSPMESMGLYVRLMKYGHIQTDPDEEDYWAHGDPATQPQLQPALGPEDWLKFHKSVQHLLPGWTKGVTLDAREPWYEDSWITSCFTDDDLDGVYEVTEPFTDANKNEAYDVGEPFTDLDSDGELDTVSESFNPECAGAYGEGVPREELSSEDFIRAGSFMAGAANKTGFITDNLTQYFNRIVKIAKNTAHTVATPLTLPALVRVCEVGGALLDPEDEVQVEPDYGDCEIYPADGDIPNQVPGGDPSPNTALFPDVLERFVDFGEVDYVREDWRNETIEGIFPVNIDDGEWQEYSKPMGAVVSLLGWLDYVNGNVDATDMDGFVGAADDGVRSIEFVHNHALPVSMWPGYLQGVIVVPPKSP